MRVCVIGGGIAGLVAARRLLEAGDDPVVLEAADRPGGVLGTSFDGGFAREHAATTVTAGAADGLVDLAAELGVEVVAASPAARQRWIWIDGALKALPRGPVDFVRTDLLTWRGKLAVLGEPFRRARDAGVAGDESIYDFAVRRLGPEAARAMVGPFVTGIFAADAHEVSLASGFPRLAELDAHGGLIRGMVARMVRGRRGGAGAGGAGGAGGKKRGMAAPAGGMQVVVDALAAGLGARVRLGAAVTAVAPADGGVDVAVGGPAERFDAAVLAVPASVAARLVAAAAPQLADRLGEFTRAPVAVVYLGLPRAAAAAALDGFGFLVAQGEDLRVLGCVMESVLWPDRAPDGAVLLRCIFGGARDAAACELDDATLIAQARADVGRALGIDAEPVHASVVRWAEGIAQVRVGHGERLAAAEALARARRLVLAGAGYHGVALNDLVADGRRVAREVAAWRT
jgi:protoporphyrinogen/coproporphyrinogen III oxidase